MNTVIKEKKVKGILFTLFKVNSGQVGEWYKVQKMQEGRVYTTHPHLTSMKEAKESFNEAIFYYEV